MRMFAVCTPGLEPFLAQELGRLELGGDRFAVQGEGSGLEEMAGEAGGVEFQGALRDVYRANLHLRTASRILLQGGSFYADTFSDLGRRTKRLPWEAYLRPGNPVSLRVFCRKSRLFHSGGVGETVLKGIGARLGQVPAQQESEEREGDHPAQLLLVRLVENRCTISVDSSGALLHRRGYRLETAKAPLRETLAAGMLMASGWDGISPLLDPFCGAGTIPIEAALSARGIPPGSRRRFAFMDWPNFDVASWQTVKAEAKPLEPGGGAEILASDRDGGAIRSARANADRAGVADHIQFSSRPISAVDPPERPGWVVTNPPYGVRLDSKQDLRRLYTTFGKVLRAKCPGWRVAMLCNSPDLLRTTGLKFDGEIQTRNGGLRVKLVWGTV
jgi:putative N6-adenine-specific DNA methylase